MKLDCDLRCSIDAFAVIVDIFDGFLNFSLSLIAIARFSLEPAVITAFGNT